MLIECWQHKVERVEVVTKPTVLDGAGALASAPFLKIVFADGCIDPLASYYAASRESRIHAPHHAFANITHEDQIHSVFTQFGFPSFEGRQVLAGEVLVEAKRLRLLMEAWGGFRAGKLTLARERLGELDFAGRHDAHWFYWPPPLLNETDEMRANTERYLQFLERDLRRAAAVAARYTTKGEIYHALVSGTEKVCAVPLSRVEFTPEIQVDDDKLTVHWGLRPVRFLGEEDLGQATIAHEEPYIAAPYGLMFLLELSAGSETRVCADPFCRRVFGASRRNQSFCSQLCAHRVAVRNSRQRQRGGAVHMRG